MEVENTICGELVKYCFYCGSDNILKKDIGSFIIHKCNCCHKKNIFSKRLDEKIKFEDEKRLFKGYNHKKQKIKASKKIGRKLTDDEVVHHINFTPSDNHATNLWVCSPVQHSKAHWSFKRLIKKLVDNKIVKFDEQKGEYIYE